jgi:CBS domain-containing protein
MEKIRDVMTPEPLGIENGATVMQAARMMRENDIGDVIVLKEDGRVCGIVTDRDIVVRSVAEGADPNDDLESICRHDVVSIGPGNSTGDAVQLMRQYDIRRLPVIEGDRLVGIVSLGDLAIERDPDSALADISLAPPNN